MNIGLEMENLSSTMEEVEMVRRYIGHYKYAKEHTKYKNFEREYSAEIKLYTRAANALSIEYKTLPKSKETLENLFTARKKNSFMKAYSLIKEQFSKLVLYQTNYDSCIDKEVER